MVRLMLHILTESRFLRERKGMTIRTDAGPAIHGHKCFFYFGVKWEITLLPYLDSRPRTSVLNSRGFEDFRKHPEGPYRAQKMYVEFMISKTSWE